MSIPQEQSKNREDVPRDDFFERLLEERDRLYTTRFDELKTAANVASIAQKEAVNAALIAQKEAVNAALIAQKEAVNAAFLASEKAILKAEDAQKEYNIRSNEFRGQLDDQAKTLMPRPETLALFNAVDEKLIGTQSTYENKIEGLRTSFEKSIDSILKDLAEIRVTMQRFLTVDAYQIRHSELQQQVSDLRESRSEVSGKSAGANALWGYLVGAAGLVQA